MSVLSFVTGKNSTYSSNNLSTPTSFSRRTSSASVTSGLSNVSNTWKNASNTTSDDIFRHLTIKQIQALSREYHDNIDVAKKDIHTLVGSKYRDLIEIAEDIDKMYDQTITIDSKLSKLSYQNSSFVSFTGNEDPLSRFDSIIRRDDAAKVRKDTSLTILKNLITTKLISFDLIISGSSSNNSKSSSSTNYNNSANLVFYAKYYYSIEVIFKDILASDHEVRKTFNSLKNNFNSYLENNLSTYTSTGKSLSVSNLFSKKKENKSHKNQILLNDRYDLEEVDDDYLFELDSDIEDELEKDKEDEEEVLGGNTIAYYNKLPIENYLIAYIILNANNQDLDSLSSILESFTSLRCNFLSSIFAEVKKIGIPIDELQVDFYKILKYIEVTFDIASKYFEVSTDASVGVSGETSQLSKSLNRLSSDWKATDILGFHNWFDNENITFPRHPIDHGDPTVKTARQNLLKFPKILASVLESLLHDGGMESSFQTFQNFIDSLRKLERQKEEDGEDQKPVILELLKDEGMLIHSLDVLTTQINSIFSAHFEQLVNEDKDLKTIMSTIKYSKSKSQAKQPVQLFSNELSSILDNDIDKYMDTVSLFTSASGESLSKQINQWFNKFKDHENFVQSFGSQSGKRLSKDWGNFNKAEIQRKFNKLESEIHRNLWDRIDVCINEITEVVNKNENDDLSSWFFFLNIIIRFKENLFRRKSSDDEKEELGRSIDKFDDLCKSLFKEIITNIPKISGHGVNDFLSDAFTADDEDENEGEAKDNEDEEDSDGETESLPTRPSFKLASSMYNLSVLYLNNSANSSGCLSGQVYLEVHAKNIFMDLKNEWVKENAVKLSKRLEDPINKQRKLEVFADVVYLLQFTKRSAAVTSYEDELLAEMTKKIDIDDETEKIISKGVSDFYKSNQVLYLPLSI